MSNFQENTRQANELRFARKVRQALEESTAAIAPERLERLAAARKAALRAHSTGKPALQWLARPAFAGHGAGGGFFGGSRGRGALAFGLVILVGACIVSIFSIEQERRISETADIDAALLSDEIPLSAYADHGFNAFVKQNP
jgi:hypothetical protein